MSFLVSCRHAFGRSDFMSLFSFCADSNLRLWPEGPLDTWGKQCASTGPAMPPPKGGKCLWPSETGMASAREGNPTGVPMLGNQLLNRGNVDGCAGEDDIGGGWSPS